MKVSDIIQYYIHYEDYVKRFKTIHSSRFTDIQKALKVQILNEVALIQVVRKRVSFHDRKNENTPKFPKYYTKQHSHAT